MGLEGRLDGMRIGVFGKGGAGKSTVVVLLANVLRTKGYAVVVLDADSTNEGLHKALGLQDPPRSLLDYFGGMVFSGGAVTCPVDDPTPLPNAEISLRTISREHYRKNRDGIVLLSAGKVSAMSAGSGCDGPISKIIRDIHFTDFDSGQVILIDFKAGFEDIARGVVTSLDWVLVVVDPTVASIRMAVRMTRVVELLNAGTIPATKHLNDPHLVDVANRFFQEAKIRNIFTVLNRIDDASTESYIRKKLAEEGIEPIGTISTDPAITSAWLKGKALPAKDVEFENIMLTLEAASDM
jgi:CO dehydrogenase nickel-insertion accessory protein CooC1